MNKLIIGLFLVVSYLAWSADALCCPWVMTPDVKCTCDDGSKVAPWECCSEGACNVFCCNCGGPCKKKAPGDDDEGGNRMLRKRSVDYVNREIIAAAAHFSNIDRDDDLTISVEEAREHLNMEQDGVAVPAWFGQVDADGDGLIRPSEFDADLDEMKIVLFAK